jgi:hypothetical protein
VLWVNNVGSGMVSHWWSRLMMPWWVFSRMYLAVLEGIVTGGKGGL